MTKEKTVILSVAKNLVFSPVSALQTDTNTSASYPLTEPAVRPEIILRWKMTTKIMSGKVTSTLAAIINPHGSSCCDAPLNSANETGTVLA